MMQRNHPVDGLLLGDTAYKRLFEHHEQLEGRLREAMAHPAVDWDGVKLLKREKLVVAEQMERLRSRLH